MNNLEERVQRLEKKLQDLFRSRVGFKTNPEQNVIGQATLVDGEITMPEIAIQPATPGATYRHIYPKSDGWYEMDDAGTESKIGGGGDPTRPVIVSENQPAVLFAGLIWVDPTP